MPKRVKTPPPPEDEPRYLVIVHPYPLNANLLQHGDRRKLALWVACCTGKDALYAMYYKPASPGMVIIEVDRFFDGFDSLLGKHVWTSFLKNPTEEDKDKASKVFWCHYNSGRLVQKNGWKRVDVEEHWFTGWSPHNDTIKHPYPKTIYCDVPAEAQTGVPLCRPLPKATFTPPPPKPRPTVGSPEWVQSRSSNVSSQPPLSSRRRRGNHGSQLGPSDSASVVSSAGSAIDARPPPPGQHTVQWVTDQRAKRSVWASPPSSLSSGFTLSFSTASSSVGSRAPSVLDANPAAAPPLSRPSVPTRPPGLSSPSLGPHEGFKWSDEVEISIEAQDDAPTSPHSSGTSTARAPGKRTAPSRRAPEPEGPIDPDREYEYEEEDIPKRTTADAMTAIFDGAPRAAAPVGNDAGLHDLEEEEEEDYIAWNYPQVTRTTTRDRNAGGEDGDGEEDEDEAENPWDNYDAPRWEPPTKVNIKAGEEWICPAHGSTCNPGICKARARVEFERRKEKERDERLEAKRRREEKWKKAAEKKARKIAQAEGREVSHDLPPHLTGYRNRGAGGSASDSESSSSQLSESPTGSGGPSPPLSPQDNAAGTEGWAQGGLWDDGDKASPKVSLPSGSGRSASGSNTVEGEEEARSGPRTSTSTSNPNSSNPTTRQQSAPAARSAATSTSAWSASVPSTRGDLTGHNGAQAAASERPQSVRPGDARGAAGPATPQSPPGLRQPAWGTRGTASPPTTTTSARGGVPTSSQWPTPGQSHLPSTRSTPSAWTSSSSRSDRSTGPDADAASAPWPRQGNGRQRGRESTSASSSTLSDHLSTGGAGSRSPVFHPRDGGFPTYADTAWGDPIAAAQSSRKSKKSTFGTSSATSRSAVGDDIADGQAGGDTNERGNAEAGQEELETAGQNDRTGRGRGNRIRGRRGTPRRTATSPPAAASITQDVSPPNVLDVKLPPAGPGDQWCSENVEW